MSRSYIFVSHVEYNHVVEVADILTAHVNPDMSFAGVMPLHLAVELGHVDLVAYMLHWGASRTRLDGSRFMPIQVLAQRRANKKFQADPNNDVIEKLLTDKTYLEAYVKELLPRIDSMRQAQRAMVRRARLGFAKALFIFSLLLFVAAHVLVLYFPEQAAKYFSPGVLVSIYRVSPLLDEKAFVPWQASAAQAHDEL